MKDDVTRRAGAPEMKDDVIRQAGAPEMRDDVTRRAGAPEMKDDVIRQAGDGGARDTASAASALRLSERELRDYGIRLANRLHPGSVVALIGDLGTGKTTLTKAIAEGLGVTDPVTSPTFTLINEYGGGRLPLYHFDVYRLGEGNNCASGETKDVYRLGEGNECASGETKNVSFAQESDARIHVGETNEPSPFVFASSVYAEMDQLGWEDYFYGEGICVVEWADMIEEILPADAVRVNIAHTESPDARIVTEWNKTKGEKV